MNQSPFSLFYPPGTRSIFLITAGLFLTCPSSVISLWGQIDPGSYEFYSKPGNVKKGTTGLITSRGRSYVLHRPSSREKSEKNPDLVVFLHGVKANGVSYHGRMRQKKALFPKAICVFPNGTIRNSDKDQLNGFADRYSWPRKSPKLDRSGEYVVQITKEVKDEFSVNRTFIGGHSNGGRPASRAAMLAPEQYEGLLVWEGGIPEVASPSLRQRQLPIALLWGSRGSTKFPQVKESRRRVNKMRSYLEGKNLIVRTFFMKGNGHRDLFYRGEPVHRRPLDWLKILSSSPEKLLEKARAWKRQDEMRRAKEAFKMLDRRNDTPRRIKRKVQEFLNKY